MSSQKVIDAILNQDLADAELNLEIALKNESAESLESLGDALLRLGFIQWAKRVYLQLKSILPQYFRLNLSLAEIEIEEGNSEVALAYLLDIPKSDESYINGLMLQADYYEDEGFIDVSELKLKEAVELTDEPLVRLGLAEILFTEGKFKEAINHYATLEANEIFNEARISIYERIGTCYAYLGKYEHAISFYEKALEVEVNGQLLWEMANLYYSLGEFERANIYFKQLRLLEPDFNNYQYLYAKSLVEEEMLAEAYEMIKDGLKNDSYQAKNLHLASEITYRLHLSDEAEAYLWQSLKLADKYEETLTRLSTLLLEKADFIGVKNLLAEESELSSIALWNLAKAYQALDDRKAAFEQYQAAIEDLSENPDFLKDYAFFIKENALKSNVIELLTNYLATNPSDFEIAELLNAFNNDELAY
ncbi:MAG: tetratricopeptide repeat protein [Streptococcaceae bacterium]|jgi:tetratricopeptide (TPR) repeat protein|nr:tetratricopeptide repeat protein [Streptococcaceae bacterium]